jgi:phosphopantetheinyl transferase
MPLIYNNSSPLIGIWQIDESWQDLLNMLDGNEKYAETIQDIKSEKRRCEWLATRVLLKNILGRDVIIGYKESGAPYLIGRNSNISISHTRGFASLIISDDSIPGIDIEYHSDRAWRLRKKYLNKNELMLFDNIDKLYSLPGNREQTLAIILWCAKETVYKIVQLEKIDFTHHIEIIPISISGSQGKLRAIETKDLCNHEFIISYQITDRYIITWKG